MCGICFIPSLAGADDIADQARYIIITLLLRSNILNVLFSIPGIFWVKVGCNQGILKKYKY